MNKLSKFLALFQLGLFILIFSPFFLIKVFLFLNKKRKEKKEIANSALFILKRLGATCDLDLEKAVAKKTGLKCGHPLFTVIMAELIDKGLAVQTLKVNNEKIVCYYKLTDLESRVSHKSTLLKTSITAAASFIFSSK